jgi:hypothetical protein
MPTIVRLQGSVTIFGGSRDLVSIWGHERLYGPRVARYFIREKLQRHEAMAARVLGFIDHAHATTPELPDDALMRDGRVDHAGSRRWRILDDRVHEKWRSISRFAQTTEDSLAVLR